MALFGVSAGGKELMIGAGNAVPLPGAASVHIDFQGLVFLESRPG